MNKDLELTFEMVDDIFSIAHAADQAEELHVELRTLKIIYDNLSRFEQLRLEQYYAILVQKIESYTTY